MENNILHNTKCWLTSDGRLEVYDAHLATKINKYLQWYMDGSLPYRFRRGEEAVFRLTQVEINDILQRFLIKKRAIGVS